MAPLAFQVAGDDRLTSSAMLYSSDPASRLDALFVLAHGAGAGQSHPFIVRYAKGLAERGLDVVTFNFPYMEAGRRAPDRAPVLEASFRQAIAAAVAHRHVTASRLFIGGKSMGGRIATHLAASLDVWPADTPLPSGVIVFGYPLNPPGGSRVSTDRVSHLRRLTVPTLIVQGTRDTFGGPDAIAAALEGASAPIAVHAVEGGDHSLATRRKTAGASTDDTVFDVVITFVKARKPRPRKHGNTEEQVNHGTRSS